MIQEYLGIDSDYIIIGLAALLLVFVILTIVNIVQISKLKKKYTLFMGGKNAKSLEEVLMKRMNQIDGLAELSSQNEKNIEKIFETLKFTYQKMGLIKYDAFQQMGGQLSFSLALLDENNTGFIINSVHSTEGCYSYTKEIRNGTSAIDLSAEEAEALAMAMGNKE